MEKLMVVVLLILLVIAAITIYRLLLHPLARVPGPKLAALTSLHEFHYDCLKGGGGQHAFKLRKMHDQYGPCIRIGPSEIHVDGRADPWFWDVLYNNTTKLDKDRWYYGGFGPGFATVSTGPTDLHRIRRASMASYFSAANVRKHEALLLSHVDKLCERVEEHRTAKKPLNLHDAYRALALDVVSAFMLPEPRKHLSSPDFGKHFNDLLRNMSGLITAQRHLRIVFPILMSIPDWVTVRMDSTGAGTKMVEMQNSYDRQVDMAVKRRDNPPPPGFERSVLDDILASSELAESDKTRPRLGEETRNTVGAGTETTGSTLSALTYYVLANAEIHSKLKVELRNAAKDSKGLLGIKVVEKLPYLQACINEALRIVCPVTGRLPRCNPRAATSYNDGAGNTYTFPPGTVMSMSMPDMHFNSSIFPDPHAYRPERWLEASQEQKQKMDRYLVAFGKGSRGCIGLHLAMVDVLLTVGNLFNMFDFELFETTERDVSFAHDFFAPFPPADCEGVRVKVL